MKTTKQPYRKAVIGIDLGDKQHAICVLDKNGNTLKEFSIPNHEKYLQTLADDYPKARIGMEVGTHSPWISRLFTARGMDVFVANARKLRAIYTNERKSDKVDARMLARITRMDPELLHPVSHGSEQNQMDFLPIKLRDTLVRQRAAIISSIRTTLKALGVRLSCTSTESFARQARAGLTQRTDLLALVEPSLLALESLCTHIAEYDKTIAKTAVVRHPQAGKLQAIAGVGPITSLSFVLSIEDPSRFKDARDVGAFLGLVPRRDQSGATDKQLPISKAGDRYLRGLLVQASQYVLGHFGPDCDLRRYGLKLAARGGKAAKKKAVIAVARKLAVVMLTLWQKQCDYEPLRQIQAQAA
jgi:transposase